MIIVFGYTGGKSVEHDGVVWTLDDDAEADVFLGAKFRSVEPHAYVTSADGRHGEMFWKPVWAEDIDGFTVSAPIAGVLIYDGT